MMFITRLIIGVYAILVRCYPLSFRAQFEEEMRQVFADAVTEAAEWGRLPLMVVCLQEVRDLPSVLLREILSDSRERRKEALMSETVRDPGEASLPECTPASWATALAWA